MGTIYEIPLVSLNQTFRIALGGVTYSMRLVWRTDGWVLDISASDNTPLVMGIAMVTGTDLLGQYRHLGFTGSLILDSDLPPTIDNLGTDVKLYFVADGDG